MDIVSELVLRTLCAIHGIAGYNPTVGEIAKICMLSEGLVCRRLGKLIDGDYVVADILEEGKIRYRFWPTQEGIIFINQNRRYL